MVDTNYSVSLFLILYDFYEFNVKNDLIPDKALFRKFDFFFL